MDERIPQTLRDLLKKNYDADTLKQIEQGYLSHRHTCFRVNRLKGEKDEVLEAIWQAGLDPKSLQYVMGHSDPEITMSLYTHSDYDFVEKSFHKVLGM